MTVIFTGKFHQIFKKEKMLLKNTIVQQVKDEKIDYS